MKITPFLVGSISEHYRRSKNISHTCAFFGTSYSTTRRVLLHGPPRGVRKPRKQSANVLKRRSLVCKLALQCQSKSTYRMCAYPSAPAICADLHKRGFHVAPRTVMRDLLAIDFKCLCASACRHGTGGDSASPVFARKISRKRTCVSSRIVFSDEHLVSTNDHSWRMQWVRDGDELHTRQTQRIHNIPRVMVWAAIGVNYKSPLVLLKAPPNSEGRKTFRQDSTSYIRKCLSRVAPQLAQNRILMQDGASCHTSHAVSEYLARKGIAVITDWPSHSPDMNPIEQVWGLLNRRISELQPSSQEELERSAVTAWNAIPQSTIDAFAISFVNKVKRCASRGGKC